MYALPTISITYLIVNYSSKILFATPSPPIKITTNNEESLRALGKFIMTLGGSDSVKFIEIYGQKTSELVDKVFESFDISPLVGKTLNPIVSYPSISFFDFEKPYAILAIYLGTYSMELLLYFEDPIHKIYLDNFQPDIEYIPNNIQEIDMGILQFIFDGVKSYYKIIDDSLSTLAYYMPNISEDNNNNISPEFSGINVTANDFS